MKDPRQERRHDQPPQPAAEPTPEPAAHPSLHFVSRGLRQLAERPDSIAYWLLPLLLLMGLILIIGFASLRLGA